MSKSSLPTPGDAPRVPVEGVTPEIIPASHIVTPEFPHPGDEPTQGFPDLGVRYRIVSQLGRGGMGTVYVARDLELEREVAIKVLNPGRTAPEQLARFEQEARAVAALDHRNVLAIHDIASHGGTRYIVSELLRGETLRERLRDDLPPHVVLDYALQLAHGLAAAHEKGVVHRDLKPDNIFVTTDGALKILDFGIAKLMARAPAGSGALKTATGAVLGTAEYMSPEQVRGGAIDQRSDIFACGTILYEMLAGRRPFQGGSTVETGYAILTADPPALPDAAPAELKRIARRCLEKKPEDRYPSGRELAQDLEKYASALSEAKEQARADRAYRRRLGAVLLLVAVAGIAFSLSKRPAQTPAAHAPVTLLVAAFENTTGDPVFDATLEPILSLALEGAPFINAYRHQDAVKVAARLKPDASRLDEATARLVALREGVDEVILGSIALQGGVYRIDVRVVEPIASGKVLIERAAEVPDKAGVLTAVTNVAGAIRAALGDASAQSAGGAQREAFTSSSLEAAHEYALGQEMQHRGRADEALAHYTKAVELDPNLGRAYAGLATQNLNLHRREEAEKYFQKALSLIDRMSERERYRTRGLYYVFERDYDKAVEEWTALVTRYPSDTIGFVNLAVSHCMRRDMPRAIEAAKRASQLSRENVINRSNLAVYIMYSGDFEAALKLAREVVQTSPTYVTPRVVIALSELGSGHGERALTAYEELPPLGKSGGSMAAQGIADLLLFRGKTRDAIAVLERQIPVDEADNRGAAATKLVMLAGAQLATGQGPAAAKSLEKAVALSKSEPVLFAAARVHLAAGNEKAARALAADLAARRAQEPQAYARLIEGEAALRHGDSASAIKILREAQRGFDTWIGRFLLGRAYLEAKAFAEAHEEFEACVKRRGEATALFIDEVPTYRFFPETIYWLAKSQEGLKSPAAAESYRAFLALRDSPDPTDTLATSAKAALTPK